MEWVPGLALGRPLGVSEAKFVIYTGCLAALGLADPTPLGRQAGADVQQRQQPA